MSDSKLSAEHTVAARKAMETLWQEAHLKGRCWGPRNPSNRYAATNITIAIGDQLVSVSWRKGKLVIHEFVRTKNTLLGRRVKKVLQKHGLPT